MSVFITNNLVMSAQAGTVQPLTHARIGYENVLDATGTTFTASSAADGFAATNVKRPATDAWWKPQGLPATLEFEIPAAKDADYIGIASHDMAGFNFKYEYFDGNTWVEITEFAVGDNSPIMILHDEVTTNRFRITLTGTGQPRLGVVYIGKALAMQRPIYGGVTPPIVPDIERRPNQSDTGQFLGYSVVRRTQPFSASWNHLKANWYRSDLLPFLRSFETKPAFISWRPSTFPDEVVYMWSTDTPRASNMGVKDYVEISISGTGIGVAPDGRTL